MSEHTEILDAAQSTQRQKKRYAALRMVETTAQNGVSVTTFKQDVENFVCGKINASKIGEEITPPMLYNKSRKHVLTTARRWIWFILYHHPISRHLSSPNLGRVYHRDHTTVIYGIGRVEWVLKNRPNDFESVGLSMVCHGLNYLYTPSFDPRKVVR